MAFFLLSWVCSAILAQLIYRFCGAIYRTGTAQRHEFDDHRGNWLWWPPLAKKNLHRHSTFIIPGKPEFYDHQSFTARHWRRVGFKFRVDLIAKLTYELKYEFHFSAIMPSCPLATASLFASPLFASSATRSLPACHCKPPRQPAVCLLGITPFRDGRMDDGAHDGADGRMMVQMMVQMDDGSLPSLSLAVCRLREFGFRHANWNC